MMDVLALQAAAGGGQVESVAQAFGVDWPHLLAQSISFGVVCVVLYKLAYTPILQILETRRQQIASGLANAGKIKAELARIESERQAVLIKAEAEGKQLIVGADETRKATAAAAPILVRTREETERERARMLADVRHEVGRLVIQTTASVTGKILTADDQNRLAEETARQLAF